MARRLLGTATTDSNGIATVSYTGTGAGEIDVVATATLDGSSLVSEPYTVWDTLFYDKGADGTGNHNDTGWTNARLNLSRDEATKLEWDGTSSNGMYYRSITPNTPICIEFDVYLGCEVDMNFFTVTKNWSTIGACRRSNNTTYGLEMDNNTWYHLKVEIDGANSKVTNTNNSVSRTFDLTDCDRVSFLITTSTDNYIKYKEFKVYSI